MTLKRRGTWFTLSALRPLGMGELRRDLNSLRSGITQGLLRMRSGERSPVPPLDSRNHSRLRTRMTSENIQTARALLLALYTLADLRRPLDRVTVGGTEMSADSAARMLASIPKPLQCTGACEGDALAVTVEPVEPQYRPVWNSHSTGLHSKGLGVILNKSAQPILFRGLNESIALSVEEANLWFRSYLILNPHTISQDLPSAEEEAEGFEWVIWVSPGATFHKASSIFGVALKALHRM